MVAPCPLPEQTYWVSNHQARSKTVTLAALHESVGGTEAISLARFTQSAGVSYHAIADNDKLVYTVPRSLTAWHIRNGNSRADGLCLCTPVAGYTRAQWLGPQLNKVKVAGWWLALVCADRGLDLGQCSYADIRAALAGDRSAGGTTTHNDYTQATHDGTHTDPRNFPVDVAIQYARQYAGGGTPAPTPEPARRSEVSVENYPHLTGKGRLVLGAPVGNGAWSTDGYLSVTVSEGKGSARVYAQGPAAGVGDWWHPESELTVNTTPGQKDTNLARRSARRIPAGTSVLLVDYDFSAAGNNGGTVTLELK